VREKSLRFLEELIRTPSPSGHEGRGQRVWLDYVMPYSDEVFSDDYGNAVAVLNKGGSPRLMLCAHADEIAMSVNYISDDGFVYVRRMGGVDPAITRAQRVTVHNKRGPVKGVVGNVAPHLQRDAKKTVPEVHELFIDIGVGSRAAALKLIQVGDPITLNDGFELLRGDLAVARAFDNRAGTFAVAEALRALAGKAGLQAEVLAVSNIMEEVGLYGARQIAYTLKPDVALVVDVTHATDCPLIQVEQHGDVRLGAGPTLTHGGCNHVEVVRRLEAVAAKQRIKLQREATSATTGTDTDVVFWTRGGIPSALISLPNRYMHSPVEVVSLADLEQIPKLMTAFAMSLRNGERFKLRV